MQGVTLSADALKILDDHDFEPTEFRRVGYSIGMAMAAADMTAFDFIEGFYNPRRRRSALGYLSPAAFEHQREAAA